MPNYNISFTSWSDNSGTGTRPWSNPANAHSLDGAYATSSNTVPFTSHYLLGVDPNTIPTFASNELLTSVTISVSRLANYGNAVFDSGLFLVSGGVVQSAVNKAATSTAWPVTQATATYTFAPSDLATLAITKSSITSSFGVALVVSSVGDGMGDVVVASVDQIAATLNTTYLNDLPHPHLSIPGIGIRSL